jgi:hypothetical protein
VKALQISQEILTSELSFNDLNAILETIDLKRRALARSVKSELKPGSLVSFSSKKLGQRVTGSVVRIMTKNVVVNCGVHGQWRVPASMLQVAQ